MIKTTAPATEQPAPKRLFRKVRVPLSEVQASALQTGPTDQVERFGERHRTALQATCGGAANRERVGLSTIVHISGAYSLSALNSACDVQRGVRYLSTPAHLSLLVCRFVLCFGVLLTTCQGFQAAMVQSNPN